MVELNAETRKTRQQALVQPVTRFAAAMVLTVVNGRLELRPERAEAPVAHLTSQSR